MTTAELRATQCCSFCMKAPGEVATIVAGAGVFICNECVDLCNQLIASKPQDSLHSEVQPWEQRLTDEELLTHLPRIAAVSAQVEENLTRWVRQARSRGITWARIGEALGITRQSAWERFSGEE